MERELLVSVTKKDLDIQTFCSGGPGGQHQNKTASGVRIVHHDSGAVGESRSERSQHQNKKIAFDRLIKSEKFKVWISRKNYEATNKKKDIEKIVNSQMKADNIRIEVRRDDKWVIESETDEND